tara:strand:+ start:7596 stop:7988 length:393 start_codon:yes stop_codon:yes gene_type:complete
MENLIEKIAELNPKAITLEGLDKAIVGTSLVVDDELPRVSYSVEKIIEILMSRDGMTRDEAQEFFDFNIFNAYMGEYNPSFLFDLDSKQLTKELEFDINESRYIYERNPDTGDVFRRRFGDYDTPREKIN